VCYVCALVRVIVAWVAAVLVGKSTTCRYQIELSRFVRLNNMMHKWTFVSYPKLRSAFKDLKFPEVKPASGDHPAATAERNAFPLFADNVANKYGYTKWNYQCSKREQTKGQKGFRAFYDAKDVEQRVLCDEVTSKSLVTMTDVDYYVDMPRWLAENPVPHLIYTLQPEALVGKPHNAQFTFSGDKMVMDVTGGGNYSHGIWNYCADAIAVTSGSYLHKQTTFYKTQRIRISDHRYAVLLVPTLHTVGLAAYFAERLEANNLARLETTVEDEFEWLDVISLDGDGELQAGRSIRRLTGTTCARSVEIDLATLSTLWSVVAISKRDITAPTIRSYLSASKDLGVVRDAAIICDYLRNCSPLDAQKVSGVGNVERVRNYVRHECITEEMKPSLHAYMPPLLGTIPYAPYNCKENDVACVKTRVTDIQHHTPVEITPRVQQLLNEFIEYFVAEQEGKLEPTDVTEVYDNMPRPTQQAGLQEADIAGPWYTVTQRVVKAFQKAEAYPDTKDPRNISTINPVDKLEYSRYTYALAKHVKRYPWYSFGRTPRDSDQSCNDLQECRLCNNGRFLENGWTRVKHRQTTDG